MGIKSFFSTLFGGASEAPAEKAAGKSCCCDRQKSSGKKNKRQADNAAQASNADLDGFVEYVVKALVDFPEDVKVASVPAKDGRMISIVCRPGDRGKIIGKKGKTIMALRALVAGAAGRLQDRVTVEVMDDENEVKN